MILVTYGLPPRRPLATWLRRSVCDCLPRVHRIPVPAAPALLIAGAASGRGDLSFPLAAAGAISAMILGNTLMFLGSYLTAGLLFSGAIEAITRGYHLAGRIVDWAMLTAIATFLGAQVGPLPNLTATTSAASISRSTRFLSSAKSLSPMLSAPPPACLA